jgi:GT2 family glycosyltransferase
MQSKIYILTAVHNDIEDTKKLLISIYSQTFKNFEVYIVDAGSTDGTSSLIQSNYPQVNVIKGNGGLWWTGSLNKGLKEILKIAREDDCVWIINNDCFFDKNVLQKLLNCWKKKGNNMKIIGSIVLDSKTRDVWDSGVVVDWTKLIFFRALDTKNIDALSTKGTLYPVSVFKDVGLFDAKHFPHYFSDYEFSIRSKRNGYDLFVCPGARIYNRSERTGYSKLSFSKKSKINPFLQLNIIRFACPSEYRLKNYFLLISKLFRGKK